MAVSDGRVVMVCVGHPGIRRPGQAEVDVIGQWLKSYDPEAHDGQGSAEWTADPAQAMTFPTVAEAFELWRTVPASRPTRAHDGAVNRPLTAFTVAFESAPAGAG